ncbi:MAG: head GIN domain-containing protein [Chitinophagia bacterium]|jgi:hypothetical protein
MTLTFNGYKLFMMMKYFLLPVFIIAGLLSRSQDKILLQDPNAVIRDISNFNSLIIRGPFKVYYSSSSENRVAVSANTTDARDNIVTKVSGSVLNISLESSGIKWWGRDHEFKIYISSPTLNRISATGAVDIVLVDLLKADALELDFTGASDLVGKIQCNTLNLSCTGASDIEMNGKANSITARLTGASSLKASAFTVKSADLSATGASNIKIGITEHIKANATGASNITYFGNPKHIEHKATGASSVKKGN